MSGAADVRALPRHLLGSPLLRDARHLLVAVSGGVDSMALLHALRFHCDDRWKLTVAHLDHGIRGDSADVAAWLAGIARAWNLPLIRQRASPPPRGEAAARHVRYAFLDDARREAGADVVVTAHHADDQAETLLLRLARGTGIDGLAGIRPRRGHVVRPLLELTRAQLEAYTEAHGIAWREDSTNRDLQYARNRIRHVVLPALEQVHGGATAHIARLSSLAWRERSAWRHLVLDALADMLRSPAGEPPFVLARERVLAYHPVVRARALRALALRCGASLDRAGTARALEFVRHGSSGASLELPGGLRLEREFDSLRLGRPAAATEFAPLFISGPVRGQGRWGTGADGRLIRWAPGPPEPGAAVTAAFDPSLLRFPLEIRTWRPGDRIRLEYGTKKVRKLFQEKRVGRGERGRLPVLVDAAGRVLWVPGLAMAEGTAASGVAVFHITVADGDSL